MWKNADSLLTEPYAYAGLIRNLAVSSFLIEFNAILRPGMTLPVSNLIECGFFLMWVESKGSSEYSR